MSLFKRVASSLAVTALLVGGILVGGRHPPSAPVTGSLAATVAGAALRADTIYVYQSDGQLNAKTDTALAFNWGGYADVSGGFNGPGETQFSAVSGTWRIPRVVCPTARTPGVGASDSIVADWVGLDGFNSDTVEQLGSMSQCFQGRAFYYVWWEMYPGGSKTISSLVRPGDLISARVYSNNQDWYKLSLVDASTPEASFTTVQPGFGDADSSAEWVVERPAYQIGITPMADYGSTTFTNMQATADGPYAVYAMYTIDATDSYLLATVGAEVHQSFTSRWMGYY